MAAQRRPGSRCGRWSARTWRDEAVMACASAVATQDCARDGLLERVLGAGSLVAQRHRAAPGRWSQQCRGNVLVCGGASGARRRGNKRHQCSREPAHAGAQGGRKRRRAAARLGRRWARRGCREGCARGRLSPHASGAQRKSERAARRWRTDVERGRPLRAARVGGCGNCTPQIAAMSARARAALGRTWSRLGADFALGG